ncbi:ATP-binding protein [Arthrobacter sp. ISL-65]|uniref:ATP-binding protein n=1 Tax=Arthrobacter sp. ISL-65 TaxID=2819112 RepID=UPI00255791C1|nr:ATP-binding protein [Arthrobacter sp. ISL-65]
MAGGPAERQSTAAGRINVKIAGADEATATVDRLLHHAHVCQTTGDSIRLTQALTGKGVM